MFSDSNFETRFGILSSFHTCLAPICHDLHILICRLPITFYSKNDFWSRSNRRFSTKRLIPCYSVWKDAWNHRGNLGKMKKLEKLATLASKQELGRLTACLGHNGTQLSAYPMSSKMSSTNLCDPRRLHHTYTPILPSQSPSISVSCNLKRSQI